MNAAQRCGDNARAGKSSGGSITCEGATMAAARAGVRRHGMPFVEDFMDEVVAEYRRRLALLGDSGARRAIEDGIALLTGYRLSGMDAAHFEMLLSTLRAGRQPAGLTVLRPEVIGAELTRRWGEWAAQPGGAQPRALKQGSPAVPERAAVLTN